jgi:hypothetical protein
LLDLRFRLSWSEEVQVVPGPGDVAPGPEGGGHLRASHADRAHVAGVLKAAFVQGMLTKDEFDLRVGQTLASRTYADLAAITADLPPGLAPEKPARARPPVLLPPRRVLEAASGLYAGAWAYVLFLSPNGGNNAWAPPLLFEGLIVYLGVLIVCVSAILMSRQEQRSGGQPPRRPGPGGRDSRRLPPAGPGGPFPPPGPGHRHAAEAARGRRPRPPSPVRGYCTGGA